MWVLATLTVLFAVILVRGWLSGMSLVDYLGLGLVYLYARLWHRCSSNGLAPLPEHGAVLLVSNHTCSADPALLTAWSRRRPGFMIAGEFYRPAVLRWLFEFIHSVPVARSGNDVRAVREALRRLEEGRLLVIFPQGGLSHAGRRVIRGGKAGVAMLALEDRAAVVPALITGGPQTPYLARAWLKPSRAHVTFGKPLDLSSYYDRPLDRKLLHEVTRFIMKSIAHLAPKNVKIESEPELEKPFKTAMERGPTVLM